MNKVLKTLLVLGLAIAVATPALAEFKFNGYFRTMMYSTIHKNGTEEGNSQQFITQRFRGKLAYTLNENVAVVYLGEVDTDWGVHRSQNGSVAGGMVGVGGGGNLGADGINLETKNVYLDVNFDNTKTRLGVQTILDGRDGIVVFEDMAALSVTQKFGGTSLTGVYAKWDEGADWAYAGTGKGDWDDKDFYGFVVGQKFGDALSAAFEAYWIDDNKNNAEVDTFFYGPKVAFNAGPLSVFGSLTFQDGEYDNGAASNDNIEGFAFTTKATMKMDGGDVGLRFMYFTEDDDANDHGEWKGNVGAYAFVKENLQQFLTDAYVTNADKHRYAMANGACAGYGLIGLVASGNHNLPNSMYVKWGAGYFMSADDEKDDNAATKREGDSMGYEIAARVGKKFFEKVDVSVNASYAGFGDFYDNTAVDDKGAVADPDDTYQAYLMVNVPF